VKTYLNILSIALAGSLLLGCSNETKKSASEIQYFAGKAPDFKSDGPHIHAVRLTMEKSPGVEEFYCSGVLVAPTIVMTAAHCLVAVDEFGGALGKPFLPPKIKASFLNGFKSEVIETKYPEGFDMYSNYVYALDVGFLVMKDAAPLDYVAQIASEQDVRTWQTGSLPPLVLKGMSYGQTQNNAGSAGTLNTLDVPYISDFGPMKDPVTFELTKRTGGGSPGKSIEFMAGFRERIACPGDSGGGVFFESKPGDWKLMGITSRTIGSQFVPGGTCSEGKLTAVYSYAFAAANFIEQAKKIKL
jgi:secreted trypsin-like serine protease